MKKMKPVERIYQAIDQPTRVSEKRTGDVGLKNGKSGAFLRLSDTGDVRLTNRGGAVLLMDRLRGSMLLSAKYLNLAAEFLNIRTRPDGFRWNGYHLNPELYLWNGSTRMDGTRISDLRISATIQENGVSRSVLIPMFLPIEKDTQFDELLAREGIYDPMEMQ
jgi:hypothetical protein